MMTVEPLPQNEDPAMEPSTTNTEQTMNTQPQNETNPKTEQTESIPQQVATPPIQNPVEPPKEQVDTNAKINNQIQQEALLQLQNQTMNIQPPINNNNPPMPPKPPTSTQK